MPITNPYHTAEIFEKSMVYRGRIIHAVSYMERLLDDYLAAYFCESKAKQKEFSDIILGGNKINLNGKRKLFDILIKKQQSDFFKLNSRFNTDMNTAMYERNTFAHNMLCCNTEALEKHSTHIGLHKFSANSRIEWYDEEKIKGILSAIERCNKLILIAKIKTPRPPKK